MKYAALRDAALLDVCGVTQDGRHLGIYPKLEIIQQRRKLKMFDARHVIFDIIKHCCFFQDFLIFSPKIDSTTCN